VLAAYLDDSGTDGNQPIVAVTGFLSEEGAWNGFCQEWQAFLNEFELSRFHATEFWSRKGRPYNRWSDERHTLAQARVCDILKASSLFGIGTLVDVGAFQAWRNDLSYFIDPDPYFFCLSRCLRTLIRGIKKSFGEDDGIAIYVDQDKGRQRLGDQLAKWEETRLRGDPPLHVNPQRSIIVNYASSYRCLPLQAADILSHALFQKSKHLISANASPDDPPFLAALSSANVPIAGHVAPH
jgi:Protein of unknown function (DUF3800)